MVEAMSWIGGLTGMVSFVGFIAFYLLNRQKLKADIRVTDADADIKSLSFLTAVVETLKKENEELRSRVKALEDEIHKMKSENGYLYKQIQIFKEALKCRVSCRKKVCPIDEKFNELGGEL